MPLQLDQAQNMVLGLDIDLDAVHKTYVFDVMDAKFQCINSKGMVWWKQDDNKKTS